MKKHEIIGFIFILIISTIYSFVRPDEIVEDMETKVEIKINVEGKYNETLIFESAPTIKDVLKELKINNDYGFDESTVLDSQTVFFIPENNDLISLNQASKEQLMQIKGIGPKTADKIITYRQKTPFKTIEEIKNVPGIGEKTYLRIRGLLCL